MRVTACVAWTLLGYYTVGIHPEPIDTTATSDSEINLRVLGGAGDYADIQRGCSGNVVRKEKVAFTEVSASVDYKRMNTPGRFGVRVQYFRVGDSRLLVGDRTGTPGWQGLALSPFAVFEGKYVALGAGYFHSFDPLPDSGHQRSLPSFYLRLGPETFYLNVSYLHTMPLLTGGYGRIGVGSRAKPGLDWWVGAGAGPYDGMGFHANADIRVRPRLYLSAAGRFGVSENVHEAALALGFRYTFRTTARP